MAQNLIHALPQLESPSSKMGKALVIATIPVGRLGTPDEIASVVAWLASNDAAFATGADFSLNGGLHMG